MALETTFYRDLAYVFGAAVVGGGVARYMRQPLILGYVIGGIMIGPFTPGVKVYQLHEFELLAEVGVILLMYSIGLEFSFQELMQVKWVAVLGAPIGIALSILRAGDRKAVRLEHGAGSYRGSGGCGGQHHGALKVPGGTGRTPLAAGTGNDWDHPGGGPGGRGADRTAAVADGTQRRQGAGDNTGRWARRC
jgi:hypothetical protein